MADLPDLARQHRARVLALPLATLIPKLARRARLWGHSPAAAEDMAQQAMAILLTRGLERWSYEIDPTARKFLIRAMRSVESNDRKRDARRRTDVDTDAVEESPPSSDSNPERSALDRERATRARDALLEGLRGSPLAFSIARLCVAEGEKKPAELAERLEVPVAQVYEAVRRIDQEMKRVLAAETRQDRGR